MKTISEAIVEIGELGQNDVTITVAPGTYVDNVSINTSANPLPIGHTRKHLKLTIASSSTAADTIINGNGAGPVFTIGPNANVELDGLTITNGIGGPVQDGTGGGGILINGGSLKINSCVISDNQAEYGAGIYANDTDLDIENSSIIDNVGQGDGAQGGGIYYASAKARRLKIVNSTIDGNSASFSGGGIFLYGSVPKRSSAEIINSTISNNTTDNTTSNPAGGAGLDLVFAKLTVLNSTISGNDAAGLADKGGAIQTTLSDVSMDNVTVANNSAGEGAGGIDANTLAGCIGCGRIKQKFVISNTIIADNQAPLGPDCLSGLSAHQPIISAGYNLIGDPLDCVLNGQTNRDFEGDPLLGPLQNNGGTTATQALLPGSPAIGAGNPARPNEDGRQGRCIATDQIGTPRPAGDCDIGAYQLPQ
ncbi:MAG TPA: choice-of-anchor Q domain-containing protein [Candidatus Binataceae bacterium]|nr:choice-of-anchor Q domain-containing protein [Candidatus Binataceae bacterium]